MARTLPGGATERTLLGSGHVNIHAKLEIKDSDGTWRELTNLSGHDWLERWSVDENVDDPVARATFFLRREIGALSLAPLMEASTINRNAAAAYTPLVTAPRLVRFSVAVVGNGASPAADYHQIFQGPIYEVDVAEADPLITVKAFDLGHVLSKVLVEAETPYGSSAGTNVESVMQAIVDQWVTIPPTVVVPASPGWLIKTYLQQKESVLEAIRALALQIGWDLRYMYQAATDVSELRFYQPPRTKVVVDWTFGPDEYLLIPRAPLSDADVRNAIRVNYVDAAGAKQSTTRTNAGSIATYGRHFMAITEDASSNIDTLAEAQALADAALADLATPPYEHEMETFLFWPVQLHDLIRFSPNATFYDTNQDQAVVGFHHHSDQPGHAQTTLSTRGKPMGAYSEWVRLGTAVTISRVISVEVAVSRQPIYSGSAQIGWRLNGTVSADTRALAVAFTGGASYGASTPASVDAAGVRWIDLRVAKAWTLDVLIDPGGTGTVTLTPRSIYEPTNGGEAGPVATVRLERPGVNSHVVRELTATIRELTISVVPITALIFYRTDGGTWSSGTSGSVTFQLDVESADRVVEYYSLAPDGARSEIYRLVIDQNDQPGITSFVLSETAANKLTAAVGFDDDVVHWRMWARRGSSPKNATGVPEERFLVYDGGLERTTVDWWAAGAGVAGSDVWHVVVRGYDKSGRFDEQTKTQLVSGAPAAVGALSNIVARYDANFNVVDWNHNQTVQDNAYTVTIREDGVQVVTARDAKLEPDGGSATALYGGYRRGKIGAAPNAPGAEYLTFAYAIDLRRSSDNALIATYTASVSGWYMPGGGLNPPTEVPNTLVADGQPGRVHATWVNGSAVWPSRIEWRMATSEFGAYTVDSTIELEANTDAADFYGPAGNWVKFRVIHYNAAGDSTGGWSALSAAAQIEGEAS